MNKKMIAMGVSRMALLAVFVMVPMLTSTRTAFAQEPNPHPRVVLADWVPMSASSSIKPPSTKDIAKALLKCAKGNTFGSSAFWACFVGEFSTASWNANYPVIICAAYWYAGDHSKCAPCFYVVKRPGYTTPGTPPLTTPCSPSDVCYLLHKCFECCDLAAEKKIFEGEGPLAAETARDACVVEKDCVGNDH